MATRHATSDFLDVAAEDRLYDQMRENFWFPIAYSDELKDEPQAFTLFEEQLVVVRLAGAPGCSRICAGTGVPPSRWAR